MDKYDYRKAVAEDIKNYKILHIEVDEETLPPKDILQKYIY